jgi:hypothetical protein
MKVYIGIVKTLLLGLFVAVLAPRASSRQAPALPVAEVTEAEYKVLSAYIADTFTDSRGEHRVGSEISQIVIANKTQSDRDDGKIEDNNGKPMSWEEIRGYLRKEAPTLQITTLNSFRDANTHSVPFRPSFQLPVAYELVDKAEIDAIFKKGGWWKDYYSKYPNSQGFLTLSRVGFSTDGKQAVLYAKNGCGGKCGTSTYVVMERVEPGWKVVKEILIWIS